MFGVFVCLSGKNSLYLFGWLCWLTVFSLCVASLEELRRWCFPSLFGKGVISEGRLGPSKLEIDRTLKLPSRSACRSLVFWGRNLNFPRAFAVLQVPSVHWLEQPPLRSCHGAGLFAGRPGELVKHCEVPVCCCFGKVRVCLSCSGTTDFGKLALSYGGNPPNGLFQPSKSFASEWFPLKTNQEGPKREPAFGLELCSRIEMS